MATRKEEQQAVQENISRMREITREVTKLNERIHSGKSSSKSRDAKSGDSKSSGTSAA